MIALLCLGELLLSLLNSNFYNRLVSLVHLRQLVTVVLLKHAFYAHTHIAWSTKIFNSFRRVSDTFYKRVVIRRRFGRDWNRANIRSFWHAIVRITIVSSTYWREPSLSISRTIQRHQLLLRSLKSFLDIKFIVWRSVIRVVTGLT